jgi:hypothetical protein
MTTKLSFQWTQVDRLKKSKSKYAFPKYSLLFSETLAKGYEPLIYSHECLSGPPEAAYYRILAKETTKELCIQYFFFWRYQHCYMISHRYDYEPIFVFLKDKEAKPFLIVNAGLGGASCGFHKNEIRPKSGRRDWLDIHFKVNLSPKEYYPFGKNGKQKVSIEYWQGFTVQRVASFIWYQGMFKCVQWC